MLVALIAVVAHRLLVQRLLVLVETNGREQAQRAEDQVVRGIRRRTRGPLKRSEK